jgi:hypothetical protein
MHNESAILRDDRIFNKSKHPAPAKEYIRLHNKMCTQLHLSMSENGKEQMMHQPKLVKTIKLLYEGTGKLRQNHNMQHT